MIEHEDALERLADLGNYASQLRKDVRVVDIDDAFDLLDYVGEIADQIDLMAWGPRVRKAKPQPKAVVQLSVNVPTSM